MYISEQTHNDIPEGLSSKMLEVISREVPKLIAERIPRDIPGGIPSYILRRTSRDFLKSVPTNFYSNL